MSVEGTSWLKGQGRAKTEEGDCPGSFHGAMDYFWSCSILTHPYNKVIPHPKQASGGLRYTCQDRTVAFPFHHVWATLPGSSDNCVTEATLDSKGQNLTQTSLNQKEMKFIIIFS